MEQQEEGKATTPTPAQVKDSQPTATPAAQTATTDSDSSVKTEEAKTSGTTPVQAKSKEESKGKSKKDKGKGGKKEGNKTTGSTPAVKEIPEVTQTTTRSEDPKVPEPPKADVKPSAEAPGEVSGTLSPLDKPSSDVTVPTTSAQEQKSESAKKPKSEKPETPPIQEIQAKMVEEVGSKKPEKQDEKPAQAGSEPKPVEEAKKTEESKAAPVMEALVETTAAQKEEGKKAATAPKASPPEADPKKPEEVKATPAMEALVEATVVKKDEENKATPEVAVSKKEGEIKATPAAADPKKPEEVKATPAMEALVESTVVKKDEENKATPETAASKKEGEIKKTAAVADPKKPEEAKATPAMEALVESTVTPVSKENPPVTAETHTTESASKPTNTPTPAPEEPKTTPKTAAKPESIEKKQDKPEVTSEAKPPKSEKKPPKASKSPESEHKASEEAKSAPQTAEPEVTSSAPSSKPVEAHSPTEPKHLQSAHPSKLKSSRRPAAKRSLKVFLTGGTGSIGRAVLESLLHHGHSVTCTVKDEAAERKLQSAYGTNIHFASVQCALSASAGEQLTAQAKGFDAIIHTAQSLSEEGPKIEEAALNALIAAGIATATEGQPCHLVTTSTLWVLGQTGDNEVDEMGSTEAPFPFIAWRVPLEQLVLRASQPGIGFTTALVRPSWVYGGSFVDQYIQVSVEKRKITVPVANNHYGMVHKDDLADLYRLIVEHRAEGPFNGCEERSMSVEELTGKMKELGLKTVQKVEDPMPFVQDLGFFIVGMTVNQRVMPRRALEIGWKPKNAFLEAFEELYSGLKVNPEEEIAPEVVQKQEKEVKKSEAKVHETEEKKQPSEPKHAQPVVSHSEEEKKHEPEQTHSEKKPAHGGKEQHTEKGSVSAQHTEASKAQPKSGEDKPVEVVLEPKVAQTVTAAGNQPMTASKDSHETVTSAPVKPLTQDVTSPPPSKPESKVPETAAPVESAAKKETAKPEEHLNPLSPSPPVTTEKTPQPATTPSPPKEETKEVKKTPDAPPKPRSVERELSGEKADIKATRSDSIPNSRRHQAPDHTSNKSCGNCSLQ